MENTEIYAMVTVKGVSGWGVNYTAILPWVYG